MTAAVGVGSAVYVLGRGGRFCYYRGYAGDAGLLRATVAVEVAEENLYHSASSCADEAVSS